MFNLFDARRLAGRRRRGRPAARMCALLIAVMALAAAWLPKSADAHAVLERSTPEQDAKLDAGPAYVELLFNERLDNSPENKLIVLNSSSRPVTDAKPERTQEGKGLRLALPKLKEDHYTVTYDVISADGHPVSGAYVFTVGNPPPSPDSSDLDPHVQVGHEGHVHGSGDELTTRDFIFYAARIAYYAGLLVLAGLLLWSLQRAAAPAVREAREQAIGLAGKYALCATLAYVVFSLNQLAIGEPLSEWGRILTRTTVGKLYAAELLLALAAPLLGRAGVYARLVWGAMALLAEAWSGHAAAVGRAAYSVGLDFVHLAAASLWGGGLVLLLFVWRKERTEAGRFALLFSRWALLSFLLLWATGVLGTLAFLPSLGYLLYTSWGKWLLLKAALSLVVVAIAFFIRLRLRKGRLPPSGLLRADVGLLGAIVLTVGILTYQNPLPANEPLHYHDMGSDMHVTLQITPNAPGDNDILLKVWLPERIGLPKKTVLRLQPADRSDVGFLDVPLEAYDDASDIDDFPGFVKQLYRAHGPYLPFAGKWTAQIRVTDAADNEIVRETTFRIY